MEIHAQSKKQPQMWTDISSEGFIYCADYKFSGGISRSTLVKIDQKNYLVYSPGRGLSEGAKAIIPEKAQVHIVASNSFHNIGIDEWSQAFPSAQVYVAPGARKRLENKVSASLLDIDKLGAICGENIQLLALPKNRAGEVWVRIGWTSKTFLLTCDAFFSFSRLAEKGILKWVMKINRMGPGLEISRIYEHVVVKDKTAYLAWVREVLAKEKKIVLVPCHGAILEGESLVKELIQVVEKRFG